MNKRLYGFLAIILGAIAMIAIIYFIFFYNFDQKKPENNQPASPIATTTVEQTPEFTRVTNTVTTSTVATPEAPQAANQDDAYQASFGVVANNFVERFGTYSSQSVRKLDDGLRLITTIKMQNWLNSYFEQELAKNTNYQEYSAITTQAVTNSVAALDEKAGRASVLVQTTRTEEKAGGSRVFNQAIKIDLIKSGKRWKVDAAFWQ